MHTFLLLLLLPLSMFQMNNFNGVLPASDDWTSLSIYLASDNAHLSTAAAAAVAPFHAVDEQLQWCASSKR
jgi:hypothetical protein